MNHHSKLKGFTLIELIVVIAIIGVLATLLIPNMVAYFINAKYKTANTRANLVYTSAATYCVEYKVNDTMPDGTAKDSPDASNGTVLTLAPGGYDPDALSSLTVSSVQQSVEKYLASKTLSATYEGTCCVIYVDPTSLNVKRVFWAESTDSRYVGAYPGPMDSEEPEYESIDDATAFV